MKSAALVILLALIIAPMTLNSAAAGPNAGASLVLHLTSPTVSNPCMVTDPLPACQGMNTEEPFGPAYAYVLVQKGDAVAGIGGVHFGITYDGAVGSGVDILSWNLCADNQTPFNWPSAGSGLQVSWNPDKCQHRMTGNGDPFWDGGAAVVGYFYCAAYTPSALYITPHPQDGTALIIDCAGTTDNIWADFPPYRLGQAGFLGWNGYNPCFTMHLNRCSISGAAQCVAGSPGNQYVTDALGNDVEWEITGNGTIVGPANAQTVNVQAGGPGSFTLSCNSGRGDYGAYVCSRIVTVEDAVPVQITSWGGIKTLYSER